MSKKTNIFKAGLVAAVVGLFSGLAAVPALAGEHGGVEAELQDWSFAGIFGTYDTKQLQRGFQIFQQVCSACHSANQLALRNLSEEGGPSFSEEQVKALAAEFVIIDPELEAGERPGIAADRWPAPFATELDARGSNNGALPPDFSVLAKARGIKQAFPYWAFNYFTAYQEGGADYIYNLLVNYGDAPEEVELLDGQSWNNYLGRSLAMAPPLDDGYVTYDGAGVPQTLEQYAKDVSAFMMWVADPHLNSRKQAGFRVLIFLIVFAGMMYLVKRKLWANVAH